MNYEDDLINFYEDPEVMKIFNKYNKDLEQRLKNQLNEKYKDIVQEKNELKDTIKNKNEKIIKLNEELKKFKSRKKLYNLFNEIQNLPITGYRLIWEWKPIPKCNFCNEDGYIIFKNN